MHEWLTNLVNKTWQEMEVGGKRQRKTSRKKRTASFGRFQRRSEKGQNSGKKAKAQFAEHSSHRVKRPYMRPNQPKVKRRLHEGEENDNRKAKSEGLE